jgi:NADH dehydrogenase [ubiquinone] 1 alpha subcomplex assembly factor 7
MGASTHQDGEGIEVAPLALATCENIANRLCKNGGAALLVDYGENFTPSDTLRGFKQHKQVSALSKPGETDITADVDFAACARAAAKRGAVAVGAIPQGEFLVRMGIVDRVQALISQPHVTDEKAYQILASLRQLIDGNDMGSRFKVLALYDPRVSQINTIGFPDVLKD